MIRLEQLFVYLGIVSLCWMIMILRFSNNLNPQLANSQVANSLTLVFFLCGLVGAILFIFNVFRGHKKQLLFRLVSMYLFLGTLMAFLSLYVKL